MLLSPELPPLMPPTDAGSAQLKTRHSFDSNVACAERPLSSSDDAGLSVKQPTDSSSPKLRLRTTLSLVGIAAVFSITGCSSSTPESIETENAAESVQDDDNGSEAAGPSLLMSQSSVGSTGSTIHSSPAFFSANRIVLMPLSSDRFTGRVNHLLKDELASAFPRSQIVMLNQPGFEQPLDQPDVFVTLDLLEQRPTDAGPRGLEIQYSVGVGNGLFRKTRSVSDSNSPPVIEYQEHLTITHTSAVPPELPDNDAERLRAAALASIIAEEVSKRITDKTDEFRPLPAIASEISAPDYIPPPPNLWPAEIHASPLVSWHGPWMANQSFWVFASEKNGAALAEHFSDLTQADDWQTEVDPSSHESDNLYLRATRGDEILTVFPLDDVSARVTTGPEQPPRPTRYAISYRRVIPRSVRREVCLREMKKTPPNVYTLLILKHVLKTEELQALIPIFEQHGTGNALCLRYLANYYARQEMTEELKHTLMRMYIAGFVGRPGDDDLSYVRQTAQKQELTEADYIPTTAADWEAAGARVFTTDSPPAEFTVQAGEVTGVVYVQEDEPTRYFGVVVDDTGDAPQISWIQRGRHGWSESSGTFFGREDQPHSHTAWVGKSRQRLTCDVRPAGENSYQVEYSLSVPETPSEGAQETPPPADPEPQSD